MTDEQKICEAMRACLLARHPTIAEDAWVDAYAAGLAAAVRLIREPGPHPGWSPRMWGSDYGSVFLEGDGRFHAWSDGAKVATCSTLAEAIAAVEKAHSS